MNNKFYWTVFAVVFVVLIGVGIYFVGRSKPSAIVSPPVTVTTTTTYTNNQYGFTFTLPDDWQGYTALNKTWFGTPESTSSPTTGVFAIRSGQRQKTGKIFPSWSSRLASGQPF
jgi:hypothetical protein